MLSSFKRAFARWTMCLKCCVQLSLLLWKGVNEMPMVYATLIIKGRRTYESVPETIKDQVREILIDCDCGHLCGGVAP